MKDVWMRNVSCCLVIMWYVGSMRIVSLVYASGNLITSAAGYSQKFSGITAPSIDPPKRSAQPLPSSHPRHKPSAELVTMRKGMILPLPVKHARGTTSTISMLRAVTPSLSILSPVTRLVNVRVENVF